MTATAATAILARTRSIFCISVPPFNKEHSFPISPASGIDDQGGHQIGATAGDETDVQRGEAVEGYYQPQHKGEGCHDPILSKKDGKEQNKCD